MNAQTIKFDLEQELTREIAERIVQLRKAQNLTQVEVAEAIGINQQNYSNYEKGIRKVPLKRLPLLAEALNTSLEELLGINDSRKKRGPMSQLERRFEQIKNLPKKDQQYIIETIDRVIASNTKKAS